MARACTSTGDTIQNLSASAVTSAGTIAMWIKPNWNSGDNQIHTFWWHGTGGSLILRPTFLKFNDNVIYVGFYESPTDYRMTVSDSGLFIAGVWAHHLEDWDTGTGNQHYFINNVQKASRTGGLSFTPTAGLTIGNNDPSASAVTADASMADYARWNRVLTSDERASLVAGFSPLFIPSGLLDYRELNGRNSPETSRISSETLTVTGTAFADGPRMIRPAPRLPRVEPSPPPIPHDPTPNRGPLIHQLAPLLAQ